MVTAHEAGVVGRIELVRSLVAMNQANPAVMVHNPLSKIPTLVTDDGTVLFDSDVICEYLDQMGDHPPLFPAAGEPRWTALRWNALGSGLIDALVLWRNERMRPDGHQSVPTLKAYSQKVDATLAWIEQSVEDFGARPFSIGHVALGCALGYLDLRFDDLHWREGRPKTAAWMQAFVQRPSAQSTQADVADKLLPPNEQKTG
jgi:glutathione S-transferase